MLLVVIEPVAVGLGGLLCLGIEVLVFVYLALRGRRLLGRAFQIQDDYLEIFSDSKNMGKSLGSDIMLGKKTFLMIHAFEKNREKIKIYKYFFISLIYKIKKPL